MTEAGITYRQMNEIVDKAKAITGTVRQRISPNREGQPDGIGISGIAIFGLTYNDLQIRGPYVRGVVLGSSRLWIPSFSEALGRFVQETGMIFICEGDLIRNNGDNMRLGEWAVTIRERGYGMASKTFLGNRLAVVSH